MDKIKVGFGPITTSNSYYQSGLKVASALEQYEEFTCGSFRWEPFSLDELMQFDVLVFIKYYPDYEILRGLKRSNKVLILDYQDMFLYPSVYELNHFKKILKRIYYYTEERAIRRRLKMFDLCFVASPILMDIVREAGIKPYFLQRQIYNDKNEYSFKAPSDRRDNLVLYWTGVGLNQKQNEPVLPVLRGLCRKYGCRIVYSTDTLGSEQGVEYRLWSPDTWEQELLEADIAFRWRDTSNLQRCKDANKVMSYMAAGLPVVVYPTESERRIIKDGVNGFMTYTAGDFERVLERLITEPELRRSIGLNAHKDVWSKFALRRHVEEIRTVIVSLRTKE